MSIYMHMYSNHGNIKISGCHTCNHDNSGCHTYNHDNIKILCATYMYVAMAIILKLVDATPTTCYKNYVHVYRVNEECT